jgi:hypothetical protein
MQRGGEECEREAARQDPHGSQPTWQRRRRNGLVACGAVT